MVPAPRWLLRGSPAMEEIENVAPKAAGGFVDYVSWIVMDRATGPSPAGRKAGERDRPISSTGSRPTWGRRAAEHQAPTSAAAAEVFVGVRSGRMRAPQGAAASATQSESSRLPSIARDVSHIRSRAVMCQSADGPGLANSRRAVSRGTGRAERYTAPGR